MGGTAESTHTSQLVDVVQQICALYVTDQETAIRCADLFPKDVQDAIYALLSGMHSADVECEQPEVRQDDRLAMAYHFERAAEGTVALQKGS